MKSNDVKDLKQLAKEAKTRMKNGFWKNFGKDVQRSAELMKGDGMNASKIVEYYENKSTAAKNGGDEFYERVKELLLSEGEVSDAIGRLTDKELYNSLSYEGKQKYILELSEKYRRAVARFKREQMLEKNDD